MASSLGSSRDFFFAPAPPSPLGLLLRAAEAPPDVAELAPVTSWSRRCDSDLGDSGKSPSSLSTRSDASEEDMAAGMLCLQVSFPLEPRAGRTSLRHESGERLHGRRVIVLWVFSRKTRRNFRPIETQGSTHPQRDACCTAVTHAETHTAADTHARKMMMLWWLNAAALVISLTPGDGFHLFHPTTLPSLSARPPALVQEVRDTSDRRWSIPTAAAAAATASEEAPPGGSRGTAATKERFLRNLERRRAGDDVPSSVLDVDLGLLSTTATAGGAHDSTGTTVENLRSWRGKWEICYAPHIETLGKVGVVWSC